MAGARTHPDDDCRRPWASTRNLLALHVGNGSSRHVSINTRHREWRRVGPTAWPPEFFVCLAALYAVREAKKYSAPAGNRPETGQVALLHRIETTGRPPRVRPHPAHETQ